MPRSDPFAGIKLSEQTQPARIDQRLFNAPRPKEQPIEPQASPPNPTATQLTSTEKAASSPSQLTPQVRPGSLMAVFDLGEPALYKASYVFSQGELEALEDLKLELRRELDLKVSKYDLVRAGLHMLLEDYRSAGQRSYLIRKLRKRPSR